ncbi:MAG: hypothetical protein GTO63_18635 [Anaerolineae bacterium]|nr:hypothetical protein [Anaerolineae bacterium]NIN96787.1 hypothetical protein [Anaerolineae bacterium]NIQ79783.1 hypothetical protein [Anaerolineae bacterium]
MTDFKTIFREERHFCNHLFRLLCHRKETGGKNSGLGRFLSLADLGLDISVETVAAAEIYTEVAVFRDFYHSHPRRQGFLIGLHDSFLPMMREEYGGGIARPTPIGKLLPQLQGVHPKDFSRYLAHTEDDKLFYREFSALFNAKPDFLLICDGLMIWLEVKVWTSFDRKQLRRTQQIADLCSCDLFAPLFGKLPNRVMKLGTRRHVHARRGGHFFDWADVARIAEELLPHGTDNYTAQALSALTV